MSGNRIYRGPNDRQPKTVSSKTVAGAYLPGTFVTEGATTLTQATAHAPMLRLLGNRDFYSEGAFSSTNPLLTAYASGDTGVAYTLEVGQVYLIAAAAATYSYGQALAVATAGRVAAAGVSTDIVGFSRHVGAVSAGDLIEVEIANVYRTAAS